MHHWIFCEEEISHNSLVVVNFHRLHDLQHGRVFDTKSVKTVARAIAEVQYDESINYGRGRSSPPTCRCRRRGRAARRCSAWERVGTCQLASTGVVGKL